MILIAAKGHFFTQIPHPMHSRSEINAIFDSGATSMQSFPVRTTGQDFLHSCRHFFERLSSVICLFVTKGNYTFGLHYVRQNVSYDSSHAWRHVGADFIIVDDSNATIRSSSQPRLISKGGVVLPYRVNLSDILAG